MDITLCIIVRDEEKNLQACLESFEGVYSDLVVVDTGSTDGTVKIAESFNAACYDFQWCDDFSAARNFALSKAKTEWVMMVDADDVIDESSKEKLQRELLALSPDSAGILVPYQLPPFSEKGGVQVTIARIWKRSLNLYYVLPVHEYLAIPSDIFKKFIRVDAPIKHTKSPKNFKKSFERNLRILKKAVATKPQESRLLFYLGHDHQYSGHYEKAVQWYEKYEELPHHNRDELNRAILNKGICHKELGQKEKAISAFLKAIEVQPQFIEPYILLGESKAAAGKNQEALEYYLQATKCTPPKTHVFYYASHYNGLAEAKILYLIKQHAKTAK